MDIAKLAGSMRIEVTDELYAYAQQHYPRITRECVDQNFIEFSRAMQAASRCEVCFGKQHCPAESNGWVDVPMEMRPDGWVIWGTAPCKYNSYRLAKRAPKETM